jgi:NAD(P)H-dependent FMN reductase
LLRRQRLVARKPPLRRVGGITKIVEMNLDIAVILGTTRQGRFGEKPARWILSHLQRRADISARLLDLRDFAMPFFEEALPPSRRGDKPYAHDAVQRWTAEIAAADGFVIVTPEYNHGPTAVLKNAIDWVYAEWNRKPVGFVAYGGALGARAVEQLRTIAIEVQLAPIRAAVHVPTSVLMTHFQGGDATAGLAELVGPANAMVDDLVWWTTALKRARAS